jgi:hypothetical protein
MKKILYVAVLSCFAATVTIAAEENKVGIDATKAAPKTLGPTWAYQPVIAPAVPAVQQKKWVRTPIDAFVLAQLEEKGLKPSGDADRAVFIRRATLDAWGIVPTPEEVKAFVADRSPDAYEKLVDRLLSSPHYGERQARRWLDLARYSDSAGFTNDETRPNAWRYRDYVIKAFNEDKPYNQFIKEQVAGDELWPGKDEALVATGFLRYYPDDSNSRDLVQRKYLTTTDMVDTLGAVVLAQSVDCARCHNHKTDKVSQKEYFQLQAFFANANADDSIPVRTKGAVEAKYEEQLAQYQEASKKARNDLDNFAKPYQAAAEKYNKERFFEDTQASLFKNKDKWDAHDRWVNQRYENNLLTENGVAGRAGLVGGYLTYLYESSEDKDKKAEYKALSERYTKLVDALRKFNKLRPAGGSDTISAITELGHSDAPPTHVRFTGIHDKYQEEVQPGIPALFNPTNEALEIKPTETSSGRRSALANWLTSQKNPLTARVYVNRIWEQYFGKGIVGTVSDFGRAGERPTHPDLLNYLADNFVKDGWSIKKVHRQILLSSVYRQSSDYRADAFKADPQNKLLAVFPRQRLEAEQIRDSLLAVSGQLEDKVGGPSVFPPIPTVLTAGGRNLWTVSEDPKDHNRRSLYTFSRRSVPYPMLDVFDGASQQATHARRDVTTTPLQALTLINNDLVYKWSQNLAGRVIREAGNNEAAQLERLYQILYARSPDKVEKETLVSYLNQHEKVLKEQVTTGKLAVAIPTGLKEVPNTDPLRLAAFVDLAHTLVNANEFTYRY